MPSRPLSGDGSTSPRRGLAPSATESHPVPGVLDESGLDAVEQDAEADLEQVIGSGGREMRADAGEGGVIHTVK